jgi:hypothetical protein
VSSSTSVIFVSSAAGADSAVIRCDQSARRSAARASRKLGVFLWGYQGRVIQVPPVGWVSRYQHHCDARSHAMSGYVGLEVQPMLKT